MPKQSKELVPPPYRERYTPRQRATQTEKSARVVHALLKKTVSKVVPVQNTLKAHDPNKAIAKLELQMNPGMKGKFDDFFRGLWEAQDEFVRTSYVRDLLIQLDKRNLSNVEMARLKNIVDDFSSVRFPTRWSGFKLKDGNTINSQVEMQHPTAKNTGIWVPAIHGFSGPHTKQDEARVKVALDTINRFVQKDANGVVTLKPGVTAEQVVRSVLIAVGTFTLNYFTAPARAGNVEATASDAVKDAQTQAREFVKDQLEAIGAKRHVPAAGSVLIPKLNLPARDFRPDLLDEGEISPRRGAPVSKALAETLWVKV